MINGVHFLLYSKNAETDRAFFRDVLGFKAADGSWQAHVSAKNARTWGTVACIC